MAVQGLFSNAKDCRAFAPGQAVFAAGDTGSHMFGVVSGEIQLHDGERVLTTVGPGGVFGEMALIDNLPRSLNAVATTDTVVAAIDRTLFLYLVHETPTFALDVMRSLGARIRALSEVPVPPG
jgi:CRP/FNR family cyclic AMP-dependent transcriptional regulator